MDHPFVAVVGPTGSGKSALALFLAQHFRGEIVNCDSLQIYRHFDIGTAKITPLQRAGVPHHLIDILNPDELFSAGDFARLAREKLQEIAGRGNVPVVVGGTGFYLRALIDGLFAGPRRDAALRAQLAAREEKRPGVLHRFLRRLDAAAASRIHPNDRNKLMRAIEVCLLARQSISTLQAEGTRKLTGFSPVMIGLDPQRAELYELLNARCAAMFEHGLVAEVKHILAMGYSPDAKPFESLGYKQALLHIRGDLTLEQAIEDTRLQTRRYAKRQWTWFKADTRVSWIPGFGHMLHVQRNSLETLMKKEPRLAGFS